MIMRADCMCIFGVTDCVGSFGVIQHNSIQSDDSIIIILNVGYYGPFSAQTKSCNADRV